MERTPSFGGVVVKKAVCILAAIVLTLSLSLSTTAQDTRIKALIADLDRNQPHFTLGLDMIVVGSIERDAALGYPRSAWGVSPRLGITWRHYNGQPSHREIERAAEIVNRNYSDFPEDDWRKRVKAEVADNSFGYVGISTMLFLPGIDAGFSWDFADHRGIGGTFSLGITWGLNTFLIPVPYLAGSYSF